MLKELKAQNKKPTLSWLQMQEQLLQQYIPIFEKESSTKMTSEKLKKYQEELEKTQKSIANTLQKRAISQTTKQLQKLGKNASIEQLKEYKTRLESQETIKPDQERREIIESLNKKIAPKTLLSLTNEILKIKYDLEKEIAETNNLSILFNKDSYESIDARALALIQILQKQLKQSYILTKIKI